MVINVNSNRDIVIIGYNTQNENDVEILKFKIPDEYSDFNKKIVFLTPNGNVWDIIENDTYTLKKAITKYKQVDFYIWLTKGEQDFRTKTKTLKFYDNVDVSDEITDEEIGRVNTVINILEEEIAKVDNIDIQMEKVGSTATISLTDKEGITKDVEIYDGINGVDGKDGKDGIDGKDYIITQADYREISGIVERDIEPKLASNLQTAKDYTDNQILRDIKDITYNTSTGAFVFTRHDNTTINVDLPIEQNIKSGYYDDNTKDLVLVLMNDQEIRIPASGLVDVYTGQTSATIQVVISADNKITCNIVGNSISKTLLTTELQQEINSKSTFSGSYTDLTNNPLILRDDEAYSYIDINSLPPQDGSSVCYQFLNPVHITNLLIGYIDLAPGDKLSINLSSAGVVCASGNYYLYPSSTVTEQGIQWAGNYCVDKDELDLLLESKVETATMEQELAKKLSNSLIEEKDLLVTYEDTTTETLKLVVYK